MTTNTKKLFQVGSLQVRARADAGLNAAMLKWLLPGTLLEVEAASRRELDEWVWWKHQEGWSAERSLDGSVIYLVEIAAAPTPAVSASTGNFVPLGERPGATVPTPPAAPVSTPPLVAVPVPTPAARKILQVGSVQVRARADAGLNGAMLKWLAPGTRVEVETASRRELDGYIWWKHQEGWSAERSSDGAIIFLVESGTVIASPPVVVNTPPSILDVNTLPMRESLFKRLPVSLPETRWWQYFGNNVFAYDLWRNGTRWYAYAQGLHGGLDFGNSSTPRIPVYAGVEGGTYLLRDTLYTKPNGLWVKAGDYTIIYGHLANPRSFNRGDAIGVNTLLGELEFGGQNHLHLEVRYKDRYIINPLLLMPDAMRTEIMNKFRPDSTYFYKDAVWKQWQSPFDQPVLLLNGALIGPHAPR